MNSFRVGLYLYKKFFGIIQMGSLKLETAVSKEWVIMLSKMICGEWCWRDGSAVKILVGVKEQLDFVPSMAGNNWQLGIYIFFLSAHTAHRHDARTHMQGKHAYKTKILKFQLAGE